MENTNCSFCGGKNNFVKYVMVNKVIIIREQCKSCGYLDTFNFKKNLFNLDLIDFVDLEKRENYKNKRLFISEQKNNNFNYYNKVYLKSNEWQNKRKIVLNRDNNKCRCCNDNATEVHHINYDTLFKENFNILISVCRSCHKKIHFNGIVFFEKLKANFNILKYCHSCKNYHNDSNYFCNNCKKNKL